MGCEEFSIIIKDLLFIKSSLFVVFYRQVRKNMTIFIPPFIHLFPITIINYPIYSSTLTIVRPFTVFLSCLFKVRT